jgi:hypothetical protein
MYMLPDLVAVPLSVLLSTVPLTDVVSLVGTISGVLLMVVASD